MKKMKKVFLIVLVAVIALLAILAGALYYLFTNPFPVANGEITVPSLQSPVSVYRDNLGIAHIFGEDDKDVYFAQGYVHAQDRFYQMDIWRKMGAGRLSELFGENTLGIDLWMRTMGFARIVQKEYEQMDESSREALDAYCAGVNAYLKDKSPASISIEYNLLKINGVDVVIEPWKPEHTLTWVKIMALDLGSNHSEEFYFINLLQHVEYSMIKTLFPGYRYKDFPTVLPQAHSSKLGSKEKGGMGLVGKGVNEKQEPDFLAQVIPDLNCSLVGGVSLFEGFAFGSMTGIGSNSFVVSGALTKSGKPILANDTHLNIQIPSIWYENTLHFKNGNVSGFSFAGVPGVVIGHNDSIAWGVTVQYADTQDLIFEKINPDNPNQYLRGDVWKDMKIIEEEIKVARKSEPHKMTVRVTDGGPIVSDLKDIKQWENRIVSEDKRFENTKNTVMALKSTFLDTTMTIQSILKYSRAKNKDEFIAALRDFHAPALNILYASTDGSIGYQCIGNIPVRAKGNGTYPVPAWTGDYAWKGYIPFDELPSLQNPANGYIISANNAVVHEDEYPYFLASGYPGFRAKRLQELFSAQAKDFSVETMAQFQADVVDTSFSDIKPFLSELSFEDPEVQKALEMLTKWDGNSGTGSVEAFIFNIFSVKLISEIFKDQLPGYFLPEGDFRYIVVHLKDALFNLLHDPENIWWDRIDTPQIESSTEIVKQAFINTIEYAKKQHGNDIAAWKWGTVHTITYENHTFGRSGIAIIEKIFNRGPYSISGSIQTVNSSDWLMNNPAKTVMYASNRMIIDFSDFSKSMLINSSGQSGHAGHRNYDDSIEMWLNQKYHPNLWKKEEIMKASKDVLILKPAQ